MSANVSYDRSGDLVISSWSAVSPYGSGRTAFTEGFLADRVATTAVDGEEFPADVPVAGVIPDFSAKAVLGRKGTRSMDRLTAIAVHTVGLVIEDGGPGLMAAPDRVGLVLGTGSGSVQSTVDFSVDSLTGDRPYDVDPARFPNTVMNKAAAESAIWHHVRGPNSTIAGEALTALTALSYGARLYRAGRCDRVLVGSVEEYTPIRAWLSRRAGSRTALGEGGTVFLLEHRDDALDSGRTPVATLLGTRFRAVHDPADRGSAVRDCVLDALRLADADIDDIGVVVPLGADDERAALVDLLAQVNPRWLACLPLIGDTSAASGGFQVAAALAAGSEAPSGALPGRLALVTAVEPGGTVGCALLELWPEPA